MDPDEDWNGDCLTVKVETEENKNRESNQVVPGYATFDTYIQEAFDVIKHGIKATNNLPIESNFNYYSCFPSFVRAKEENVKLLLNAMQHVLNGVGIKCNMSNRDTDEAFDLLIDANDKLLDRANALMDEDSGTKGNLCVELVVSQAQKLPVNGSWNNQTSPLSKKSDHAQSIRLLTAKNIQRPQLTFKDKIDNSLKPWCPRIKDKPNSLKPLAIYVEEGEDGEVFSHPYEFELDKFVPPNDQLAKSEPTKYKSLEETPLVMIKEPSDIPVLLEDLKRYKEIAVDLEHHSYRSFQGITCLMQISTGDTDYVIDTLSLRSELHKMNEIFTKPTILKVFHGADLDIQWLQRDLSLYVVNMFDTHQAAKQLNKPYLSLAYLLKQYCNIDPDKHYQMADWRIRPLPENLLKYAREDTHYLLYIKDILRNALIDAGNGEVNILKSVYDRSTEICKQTYVKPIWSEESCMSFYKKCKKVFNNKQLYALKELHKWRDRTAREEDDSVAYVLPNHMLLNIAETLPREMQGILACCDSIPPLVRQNLLKLHKIILLAREQPLIKPILEDLRQRLTQRDHMENSQVWMYSPHDISSDMEARADLPCLLDQLGNPVLETSNLQAGVEHTVTVFDSPAASEDEDMDKSENKNDRKKKFVFISPFERYKRVLPMVAEEEAREREKQKQEEERRLEDANRDEEIAESKNRVFEHFKQVSQTVVTPRKKPAQIPLSQMHGRKRKRDSNIHKQTETSSGKSSDPIPTPTPSFESRMMQGMKIESSKGEQSREDERESLSKNREPAANVEPICEIRPRKKGDKKRVIKDLNAKGMMPSDVFDYKVVNFNNFQGGSKQTVHHHVNVQQTIRKKKERTRKKKKLKVNI